MRKTLVAALLTGAAVTMLPATPAAANCYDLGEDFGCVGQPCLAEVYWQADAALGDALPDQPGWACLE